MWVVLAAILTAWFRPSSPDVRCSLITSYLNRSEPNCVYRADPAVSLAKCVEAGQHDLLCSDWSQPRRTGLPHGTRIDV